MDEYEANSVVEWYQAIESELLEILAVVPPAKENLNAHSPRVAGIILESCGLLDSVFREISPDHAEVDGCDKRKKDLDMTDFAKLYARPYGLPYLRSIVLIAPPDYRSPFEKWRTLVEGGAYDSTPWWKTYNHLKHSRIAHLREATLDAAISALCGLQQVIAKTQEMATLILRHEWIYTGGWNPEYALEMLLKVDEKRREDMLAESKLFVTPLGPRPLPDNINGFRPGLYHGSPRLSNFFGRW